MTHDKTTFRDLMSKSAVFVCWSLILLNQTISFSTFHLSALSCVLKNILIKTSNKIVSLVLWRKNLLELPVFLCFRTCWNNYTKNDCVCFPSARVAVAQSSSLSLFTNRDAELEQRAMLLKRLAFTIYSSEVDQYQKYLPDIQGEHTCALHTQCFCCINAHSCYCLSAVQSVIWCLSLCSERLVESLRLPQVPILHAQVFLFFRVLLLRMSPQHLTSLWPTMITELVWTHLALSIQTQTHSQGAFTAGSIGTLALVRFVGKL